MAALTTIREDGTVEFAYAGSPPWHKSGVYVGAENFTSAEALEKASVNWKIGERDLMVATQIVGLDGVLTNGYKVVPNKRAFVREDTEELFYIGSTKYRPVQNDQLFGMFDKVVGEAGAIYNTAGSLKGGRIVFLLAELPGSYRLAGDLTTKYILIYNSHDGSSALRMRPTAVRVVCYNTLQLALRGHVEHEFRASHTTNIDARIHEAREAMDLVPVYFDNLGKVVDELVDHAMSEGEMHDFAYQLLNIEEDTDVAQIKGVKRLGLQTITQGFSEGTGNWGTNRWDAMNAVTEFVDHHRPVGQSLNTFSLVDVQDKRLEQAWFGTGHNMKQKAFAILSRGTDIDLI